MIRACVTLKENIGASDVRSEWPGDQNREDEPGDAISFHLG
jgi:hypothetical protein